MTDSVKRMPLAPVYGALALVQVFFGIQYVLAKIVLESVEPRALAVIRVSGAAVLLLAFSRLAGRRLPTGRSTLIQLAVFSIFGVILNQVLFVEGLSRTTPTHSALINAAIPVCTLLFAVALGREALTRRKVVSPLVAVVGVLLIIQPQVSGLSTTAVGDLLVLGNGMSFSLFLVLSRPLLGRVDPVSATAVLMAFGAVGISLLGAGEIAALEPSGVTPLTWLMIGYIIVFPTALAYLLQYWALGRVDSSMVAFFIYLQPVIATALSMLFLGERPGALVAVGGLLIFAAVYLVLTAAAPYDSDASDRQAQAGRS